MLVDLPSMGCIGISGKQDQGRGLARAMLAHLASHHWNQDVNLAVVCNSTSVENDWQWLDNIPHKLKLGEHAVINSKRKMQNEIEAIERELQRRQSVIYYEKSLDQNVAKTPLPSIIIFFDHVTDIYDHAAFSLILEKGSELGVYGIILTDKFENIPGECKATLELDNDKVLYKETGTEKKPYLDVSPDLISIEKAKKFSLDLSQIQWLIPENVTDPPDNIFLSEMLGTSTLDDLPIEKYWDGEYPFGYLRAPIGRFSPTSDLVFDLNENPEKDSMESHGPHGVIGGMTGSGKSELLRTIILSLAIIHHPYDVNFALIDYKGGGAFKDLENLPHVVGVITDIESHANYAGRVIQSLTGEVNTRKHILAQAKLDRLHIEDYKKLPLKRPLPRLIIIFDEFAEFKDQHPDESRKLINIARQGRSLGIHLILCTQNPSTAIDAQVKQNSKFTIALGVNSPEDSRNLIGIPDAFGLVQGKGYIFVKSPQKFQVAYTGNRLSKGSFAGDLESSAIVRAIKDVVEKLNIILPPKVWPKPLPNRLYLPDLLQKLTEIGLDTSWDGTGWRDLKSASRKILLGRYDDPINQKQPLLFLADTDKGNNLIVFGASQSGKSNFLLTIALGIAQSWSPAQANIYCLDLGGKSLLHKIQDLPHVAREGGVISGHDTERVNSLFSHLHRQIRSRKKMHQTSAFSKTTTLPEKPDIFIFIDGLTSQFAEVIDGFNDQLTEIILEGQGLGIFVIITANTYQDVNFKIISYIKNRLVLRPLEKSQVDDIVENTSSYLRNIVLSSNLPPGRGFLGGNKGFEFQAALPVQGNDDAEQNYYLDELILKMKNAWDENDLPPDIRIMPEYVHLNTLKKAQKENLVLIDDTNVNSLHYIGLGREARPLGLSLEIDGPNFLITSANPHQGKTMFIETWITELTKTRTPEKFELFLIDFHTHSLRGLAKLPHLKNEWFIYQKDQLDSALKSLDEEINRRLEHLEVLYEQSPEDYDPLQILKDEGIIFIIIDDFNKFRQKTNANKQEALLKCIQHGEECGVFVLLSDTTASLGYPSQDYYILKHVAKNANGLALGSYENIGTYYNQAKILPGEKINDFPPGRGYLVSGGFAHVIQTATYCDKHFNCKESLKTRVDSLAKDS